MLLLLLGGRVQCLVNTVYRVFIYNKRTLGLKVNVAVTHPFLRVGADVVIVEDLPQRQLILVMFDSLAGAKACLLVKLLYLFYAYSVPVRHGE